MFGENQQHDLVPVLVNCYSMRPAFLVVRRVDAGYVKSMLLHLFREASPIHYLCAALIFQQ